MPLHAFNDFLESDKLFVFARQGITVHIKKFTTQQTDPLSADLPCQSKFIRKFQIALQQDAHIIPGRCRHAAETLKLTLAPGQGLAPTLEAGNGCFGRIDDHRPAHTINHNHIAWTNLIHQTRHTEDSGQA